jgi:hypothetical protein
MLADFPSKPKKMGLLAGFFPLEIAHIGIEKIEIFS